MRPSPRALPRAARRSGRGDALDGGIATVLTGDRLTTLPGSPRGVVTCAVVGGGGATGAPPPTQTRGG
jgi:hypothetical protein